MVISNKARQPLTITSSKGFSTYKREMGILWNLFGSFRVFWDLLGFSEIFEIDAFWVWGVLVFYVTFCGNTVKSTQYKKLALNDLWFTYQNLKSCKSKEKYETKNIRSLVFRFSPINLAFWCFFYFDFSCGLQDFKFLDKMLIKRDTLRIINFG